MRFRPAIKPPDNQGERALWFLFQGRKMLVYQVDDTVAVPCLADLSELEVEGVRTQYLGTFDDSHCYSAELAAGSEAPEGMQFLDLRQLYGLLEEPLFWVAGSAIQVVDWDRTHQFCGQCGRLTIQKEDERARVCPECRLVSYPRISPAIIVAVIKGDEILLARSPHHRTGFYSVLAGFVEPGETLEMCVRREVREEVGVTLGTIRYFGSQPWPFPNSLMIAFTAEYASGEITPQPGEIEDAGWFRADTLPQIPGPISISRRLIDWFVAQSGAVQQS